MILNNYINFIKELSVGFTGMSSGSTSDAHLLDREVTTIKDVSNHNIWLVKAIWGGQSANECCSRQAGVITNYLFRNKMDQAYISGQTNVSISDYTISTLSNVVSSITNTLSLSGDKVVNNMVISITNNNSDSVEVKSIGLVKNVEWCHSISNYATSQRQYVLMAVKILDSPITVGVGETVSVNINWEEN